MALALGVGREEAAAEDDLVPEGLTAADALLVPVVVVVPAGVSVVYARTEADTSGLSVCTADADQLMNRDADPDLKPVPGRLPLDEPDPLAEDKTLVRVAVWLTVRLPIVG